MVPTSRAESRSPGPLHLTHVEGLRAIAAYVVFVNHAYAQVWLPPDHMPPWFLSLFTYSLVAGHLSVTVFIVVSGYCLMLPVARAGIELRGGAAAFFKRRARRILPPYYGALALCLVLIWTIIGTPTGTLWDVPIEVKQTKVVAILSHLLLVQDFFGTSKINHVFWSIAVEWQIYFLFALLVWSWRRFGAGATITAALACGYALRVGLDGTRVDRAAPQYLGLFALGMLAAYVVQSPSPRVVRARESFPWATVAAACVAGTAALSGVLGWRHTAHLFHVVDLPVAVATMSLLVATSRPGESRLRAILAWRPLVFVGTFSYSVYLIHAPLLQILWQYVLEPAHLGPVSMFAALMGPGLLVVLGVAYAFFRVFEEPFMRKHAASSSPTTRDAITAASNFSATI